MSNTIAASYSSLVTLSSLADNPTTITTAGMLNAGLYADSLSAPWMIMNAGSVLGSGIALASVGTVANAGSIASTATNGSGVELLSGGMVTNAATASIIGAFAGVFMSSGAGTVVNRGNIAGTATNGSGVDLLSGGLVTNAATASITGGYNGIFITSDAGTVVNDGSIANTGTSGIGVILVSGGAVTNAASASISGVDRGVKIVGSAGIVINDGSIASTGSAGYGVGLGTGGSVSNAVSAWITGADRGVQIAGGVGTMVNDGYIASTDTSGDGVAFLAGGSVTNAAHASIMGGYSGIFITGGAGTVVNDGSIAGSAASSHGAGVLLASGGMVINQGSASIGGYLGISNESGALTVVNAGTINGNRDAILFAAGSANRLVVDPGAVFFGIADGGNAFGSTIVSTLELASGAATGLMSGIGTQFTNFGSITFDAGEDWFVSGDTAGLAGTISGFAFGDTIEVTGITVTGTAYAGGVLTLLEASGAAALKLPGSFTASDFVVTNVAAGADVSLAPCFVAGTRIRTERGAVPVEALREGDRVPVVLAGNVAPIIWLGHRHIDCKRYPDPKEVWPVCLGAGAFGPGRPFRDLWLSPDHALFINGVLIPIHYLVNGRTIRQVPRDEITYWHVELAEHNVLYAEGVPAESYLDTGNRGAFANGGPVMDLHPDFARRVWEVQACAPLVLEGPRLATAKCRMLSWAGALGHATTDDPNLHVRASGRKMRVATDGPTCRVRLPKKARGARLISRSRIPAHLQPDSGDLRQLGVAISRVWLDGDEIELDDPCFVSGWHGMEQDWRWTDGDAQIATAGASELAFEVVPIGTYWQDEPEPGEVRAA